MSSWFSTLAQPTAVAPPPQHGAPPPSPGAPPSCPEPGTEVKPWGRAAPPPPSSPPPLRPAAVMKEQKKKKKTLVDQSTPTVRQRPVSICPKLLDALLRDTKDAELSLRLLENKPKVKIRTLPQSRTFKKKTLWHWGFFFFKCFQVWKIYPGSSLATLWLSWQPLTDSN